MPFSWLEVPPETKRMDMTSLDAIPNPLVSLQQCSRFYCLDLAWLEDTELADELNYLKPKLWGLPPEHWLRERVRLLEEELKKHPGDTKYVPKRQRKPKPAEGVKL